MSVTKTSFPLAEIHQLVGGEAWPSGINEGDIVDVTASLGHPGEAILIDSQYGEATLRFNVTQKVFGRQSVDWTAPHDIPYADFYTRPVPSGEIEVERTDIVVPSGATMAIDDMQFSDFKAVVLTPGVRITFH